MKTIAVILVTSFITGLVTSEVSFRRSAGRLQLVENRLGAIDQNLSLLGERQVKLTAAVELLNKIAEAQSRAPDPNAKSVSGYVDPLVFEAFRAKTENSLQTIGEALDYHAEEIDQLEEDLLNLASVVERNAAQIAETKKL